MIFNTYSLHNPFLFLAPPPRNILIIQTVSSATNYYLHIQNRLKAEATGRYSDTLRRFQPLYPRPCTVRQSRCVPSAKTQPCYPVDDEVVVNSPLNKSVFTLIPVVSGKNATPITLTQIEFKGDQPPAPVIRHFERSSTIEMKIITRSLSGKTVQREWAIINEQNVVINANTVFA